MLVGAYEQAQRFVAAATGITIGKQQLEQITAEAAADPAGFYPARAREQDQQGQEPSAGPLAISADGKGVAMLPGSRHRRTKAPASGAAELHAPRDPAMEDWVIAQGLDILRGRATHVAQRIRRLAEDHPPKPGGSTPRSSARPCTTWTPSSPTWTTPGPWPRARPIATGVIEGACRHLVAAGRAPRRRAGGHAGSHASRKGHREHPRSPARTPAGTAHAQAPPQPQPSMIVGVKLKGAN